MSLNDGALDDIGTGPLDDDLIKKPTALPSITGSATIVAKTAPGTPGEAVSQQELEALPSKDVTFKLVNDGVAKLVSLSEVESTIVATESISQDTVQHLSIAFEDLLTGPVSLKEFTKTPSKTNLPYVKQRMKANIAKEEASLLTNFEVFIDQPLSDACSILHKLKDVYIKELRTNVETVRAMAVDIVANASTMKDAVVPYGETFVNLTKIDFGNIDFSLVKGNVDTEKLTPLVECIKRSLKDVAFGGYVNSTIDSMCFPTSLDVNITAKYSGVPVTLINLAEFYTKDINADLDDIVEYAEEKVLELMKLQETSKANVGKTEVTAKFVAENMLVISETFKSIDQLVHLVNNLSVLTFCTKHYFSYIKSL